MQFGFEGIAIRARGAKPRRRGQTMMIDWGMGLARQADTLDRAAPYIDIAKIAASIPRLMPRDVLAKKLTLYRAHEVKTAIGGMFVEIAYRKNAVPALLDEAARLGFAAVEVSDNFVTYPPGEKARLIRACASAGLSPHGEVGKKTGTTGDDAFLADIEECLQAGAVAVYLEAYELFPSGEVRGGLIEAIGRRFPPELIFYELPVIVLKGITRDFKHAMTTLLIKALGPEVNLANVEWDELYLTELMRRGIGDDPASYEAADGAPAGTG